MKTEAFLIIGIVAVLALLVWLWRDKTTVRIIDGCECIAIDGSYHHSLTHKGNCTNIIHLR